MDGIHHRAGERRSDDLQHTCSVSIQYPNTMNGFRNPALGGKHGRPRWLRRHEMLTSLHCPSAMMSYQFTALCPIPWANTGAHRPACAATREVPYHRCFFLSIVFRKCGIVQYKCQRAESLISSCQDEVIVSDWLWVPSRSDEATAATRFPMETFSVYPVSPSVTCSPSATYRPISL